MQASQHDDEFPNGHDCSNTSTSTCPEPPFKVSKVAKKIHQKDLSRFSNLIPTKKQKKDQKKDSITIAALEEIEKGLLQDTKYDDHEHDSNCFNGFDEP